MNLKSVTFLLVSCLALAGCKTSEERAEEHYQNALILLEEGEFERGIVELRNVFDLDNRHMEARFLFARTQEARGNFAAAAAQYRLLAEQFPNLAEPSTALANLAVQIGDWNTAVDHGTRAYNLAPEEPANRALYAMIAYNAGERETAFDLAEGVIAETPASTLAQLVVVAGALDERDLDLALKRIDTALNVLPEVQDLHAIKLKVLTELDRSEAIGTHLQQMLRLFPENTDVETALVRWYMSQNRSADAEALLRERARQSGDPNDAITLIRFLYTVRGIEEAQAELRQRIDAAAGIDLVRYKETEAELLFERGDREAAIAALSTLTQDAPPSDEVRTAQVTLAQMLLAVGNAAEADTRIEAVLESDPDMIAALKFRAQRLTDRDDTQGAIRDLRRALDQDPRDAEILVLMALAHEREGARELAGERLALAVEVSNNAVSESLLHARFLLQDARLGAAEAALTPALRRAPDNPGLLVLMGRVHLSQRNYAQVERIASRLDEIGTAQSFELAATLRTTALEQQQKTDETITLLERLAADNAGDIRRGVPLVQAYLRDGRLDAATALVEQLQDQAPDDPIVRLIAARMLDIRNQPEAAKAAYRALIADFPANFQTYVPLHNLLLRTGQPQEAAAVLDESIDATGRHPTLLAIKAGALERAGDFDGAIAIFEELYARDSNNLIFANNLASLLATHRPEAEALERAFLLARRLRDTRLPPFQDTYGWILARRGSYAEALQYLEPAAAALRNDPLVQYHYGIAAAGAGDRETAIAALTRALELAGGDSQLPQIKIAQNKLTELEAETD